MSSEFSPLGVNLFGEPIQQATTGLAGQFVFPPFSVLNVASGAWQERKQAWLSYGIKSELGRDEALITGGAKQSLYGSIAVTNEEGKLEYVPGVGATSIFDPVVCELVYRWFSPEGGTVLDPFAGGSVRGITASLLGRHYTGIELRGEQVDANREQGEQITPENTPTWINGDSMLMDDLLPTGTQYDLVFSCPPYADLEVYSDDPADLSTMEYHTFVAAYKRIIMRSVQRLKQDRFACWVIGDIRDKRNGAYRGLVLDTINAFREQGMHLYNEAIIVTPAGSLPARAGRAFRTTRKLGRTHQYLLVFCKGDGKKAARACIQHDDHDGMEAIA